MSREDTGGPAFPVEQHDKDGMTLRDYFAAKVMQGLLFTDKDYLMSHQVISKLSYEQADAMLEARK